MKFKLESLNKKIDKLDRDCIALIKDISDKPLNEYETPLQEFVISGFNMTKVTSMIYGISRRKGERLGCSEQFL